MANIRAVSKLAGVSVATVSRALRTPDVVSEETRKKVIEAVKETGYKPNMMARNFRSKKSYSIMVLVPDISNPFFSMVISGIQQAAKKSGYSVLLGNTMGEVETERELAHLLHTNQTDGIIQLSSRFPLAPEDCEEGRTPPVINCCECVDDDSMPTVTLDNVGASRAMTDHLFGLGHKRIAVISGPKGSPLTVARLAGCQAAMKAANIPFDPALVAEGDYSMASGARAAEALLCNSLRPTAIVCFNDEMAIGAMQQIRKAGLSVPGDISITGFDNLTFAAYTEPPLTTICQPSEAFGEKAVEVLFDIIEDRAMPVRHLTLPYELVVRESTAPPSSAG
ncbi:LacI family DNA-binding transcriptional regulator [Kordiimonas aestuarii]|uniref:LacI family DNA-binding transcriptional regulator n=1 Tax=Kordiimonas aestuarii TaxID=1005925 RepID=UPI0021D0633A|nr:LacI family DNA-binding transcriptional regulator [Kordiimonas aestuarii]